MKNIQLRILKEHDVTLRYVSWYNDTEVVRYSENQYRSFTLDGQKQYVRDSLQNANVDLFGIFDEKLHIGNISIKGLTENHRRAEITYVIGDRNYWGKGIATFIISKVVQQAKQKYKLKKLCAGCAHENTGSRRALERNKFVVEGIKKRHLMLNGIWHDQIDYGLLL